MIGIPFRTEEERARLQAAADERFTTIGEFVRAAVLEKIDREKSLQNKKIIGGDGMRGQTWN